MWKAAEEIAGHEKIVKEYESIDHKKPRGSTGAWFALFFVPAILGVLASFSIFFGGLGFGLVMAIALGIVALVIGLYVLWRMAEVVSGHDKTYEKYELLVHKERKDSTVKWFIIGIIPIVNLYLLWKVGEAISGHETVYE
ncbi:hypothetical protein AKJ47_02215 [candidate division MSBL1 archaeon SCGC-AAA261G05]|nr:hypothetical protein AKJ47_02215 [candidate division MSBL1 archaeon SCGC-AAA261G05]